MEQNLQPQQSDQSLPVLQKFKPIAVHVFIPKWKRMENKANIARDLLAVERTFLSWMRTSLVLIGIGFAIVRFLYIENKNVVLIKTTGSILIATGIFSIIYSWIRSLALTKQIEDDIFSMDTVGPNLLFIAGVTIGVLCLLLVFL
jgi:putative membrane protein